MRVIKILFYIILFMILVVPVVSSFSYSIVMSLIKNIPPIVRTTIAIFLPALTSESLSMDLPGEIVSKLELIDNDCCSI